MTKGVSQSTVIRVTTLLNVTDASVASPQSIRTRGFSLIEVLIVLAIIGIVAAVGYPSYQGFLLRSHRATVQSEMQNIYTRQELYNVENRRYASLSDLGYGADTIGMASDGKIVSTGTGRYDLTMELELSTNQFVIKATATAVQQADAQCTVLTLNTNGERATAGCW